MWQMLVRRLFSLLVCALFAQVLLAPAAFAYDFRRMLGPGDTGPDVRALQVRVAGWFSPLKNHFALTGSYGWKTVSAVKAFKDHYGLRVNGVAGRRVFEILNRLEDADGSTAHFEWSEFKQRSSSSCSAKANAYAGTFAGGMVAPWRVRQNVRRLMWRLEAVRAKGGNRTIGINSGFRSVSYNSCIGGARLSQHMYGTAADNRMAYVSNHRQRWIAKKSQFSGIGCYTRFTHNHFDLRMSNGRLPSQRAWWWPRRDDKGRDLDDSTGKPCWGEVARTTSAARAAFTSGMASRATLFAPSPAEIRAFENAGEPVNLGDAD